MRTKVVVLVAAVALIVGVGVLFSRNGVKLSPFPEGCSAIVGSQPVLISTTQGENAALIAAIGVRRELPARAVSIALATAFQESKLHNLRHGDRDSLGLFQQRTSQGWGTPRQILNPVYATNKFYDALIRVPGYETMQITVAAQTVQRSAYPSAYETHAADARALASALTGYSAGGQFSCVVHAADAFGTFDAVRASLVRGYGPSAVDRTGVRQDVAVPVALGPVANAVGWSKAAYLVAHAKQLRIRAITFDHRRWAVGQASVKGWTKAPRASARQITVSMG